MAFHGDNTMAKKLQRTRAYTFVFSPDKNLPENEQIEQLTGVLDSIRSQVASNEHRYRYIVCGLERGEKLDGLHLQGFVHFSDSKNVNEVNNYFGKPDHGLHCRLKKKSKASTFFEASQYIWDAQALYPHCYFEYGPRPQEGKAHRSQWDYILYEIDQGATEAQLMRLFPSAYARYSTGISKMLLQRDLNRLNEYRPLEVTYLYGPTRTGKTRMVLNEAEHPSDVYRITNYKHPFDGYRGQSVIVFEEFRSDIKLQRMLVYLDDYVCQLPSRYADKIGTYTKVYLISNIPLQEQYVSEQEYARETWDAFIERIDVVAHKTGSSDADRLSTADYFASRF